MSDKNTYGRCADCKCLISKEPDPKYFITTKCECGFYCNREFIHDFQKRNPHIFMTNDLERELMQNEHRQQMSDKIEPCVTCGLVSECELHQQLIRAEARIKVLEEALGFYAFTAIHNPDSNDKKEQYWKDVGIYDHGERARAALRGE